MKISAVVNPQSASGRTQRRFRELARLCQERLGPVEWLFTQQRGQGKRLAREALEKGADLIISIGGDGTHNEVLNGFFDESGNRVNPDAALAFFPSGTASDLSISLATPLNTKKYIEFLTSHLNIHPADVGRIKYRDWEGRDACRYFVNVASCGISGLVDKYVEAGPKWLGGRIIFYLATVQSFFAYKNQRLSIQLDGGPAEDHLVCCLVVGNTSYFGGGMKVAPQAKINDGLLDVVCLGDFRLWDFLTKGHRLYQGTHLELEKVWHRTARKISVHSETPVYIDVDGETPGSLPAEIEVIPGAVKVFY